MTDRHISPGSPPSATQPMPLSAGAQLQLAREDAGLTLDAVAAQLKLAPRQVQAIENDDFAALPGRTFVRGFVRNYARLLQLDADAIVAALPGGTASSLESPALNPTAVNMGELPITERSTASWARWFIPLTLVAIIGAAAMYELSRVNNGRGLSVFRRDAAPPVVAEQSAATAPGTGAPTTGTGMNQPLPNPLATKDSAADPTQPGATAGAPPATSGIATAPGSATTTLPAPQAEATLSLAFHDKSWTTVRDSEGRVLLSKLVPGGQEQTLSGAPPFELIIGNATEVTLTYNGEVVDLAPFIRSGVARLSLR